MYISGMLAFFAFTSGSLSLARKAPSIEDICAFPFQRYSQNVYCRNSMYTSSWAKGRWRKFLPFGLCRA